MIATALKLFFLSLMALYQVLLFLVFCYQDRLVFPGTFVPIPMARVEGVEDQALKLADGRRFQVAVARPKSGTKPKAVILYFVGNGEALSGCRYWARLMARYQGYVAFSPEYPGYGSDPNRGRASKQACLEAADLTAKLVGLGEGPRGARPIFLRLVYRHRANL